MVKKEWLIRGPGGKEKRKSRCLVGISHFWVPLLILLITFIPEQTLTCCRSARVISSDFLTPVMLPVLAISIKSE
jgi:hypothetical protein